MSLCVHETFRNPPLWPQHEQTSLKYVPALLLPALQIFVMGVNTLVSLPSKECTSASGAHLQSHVFPYHVGGRPLALEMHFKTHWLAWFKTLEGVTFREPFSALRQLLSFAQWSGVVSDAHQVHHHLPQG